MDRIGENGEEVVQLMGEDVYKVVIKRDPSDSCAEIGTIVVCNLIGYLYSFESQARLKEEPFEIMENQSFEIGEGDTFPGMELALRHSTKGEKFRLFCRSKFAFGLDGKKPLKDKERDGNMSVLLNMFSMEVPPNVDLEYEVEVLNHISSAELQPPYVTKMEDHILASGGEVEQSLIFHRFHTLQLLTRRKQAGNRWFSIGEFSKAAKAYSKATQISSNYFKGPSEENPSLLDSVSNTTGDDSIPIEDHELLLVHIDCLNNLAACKISQNQFLPAKELCIQVLQFAPLNIKALLRAAKATLGLDNFDECEACLNKLKSLENVEDKFKRLIDLEFINLKKAKSKYLAKSRLMSQRMIQKMFNNEIPSQTNNDKSKVNLSVSDGAVKDVKEVENVDSPDASESCGQQISQPNKSFTLSNILFILIIIAAIAIAMIYTQYDKFI